MLGYLYTPEGRLPDDAKIQKIIEWCLCSDLKEVRSFLGLVSYYRIWIQAFAIIARPLYLLMKKDAEWEWTEVH